MIKERVDTFGVFVCTATEQGHDELDQQWLEAVARDITGDAVWDAVWDADEPAADTEVDMGATRSEAVRLLAASPGWQELTNVERQLCRYIILRYWNPDAGAFPRVRTLVEKFREKIPGSCQRRAVSESTIHRRLARLVKIGVLTRESGWRENGSQTTNIYRPVVPVENQYKPSVTPPLTPRLTPLEVVLRTTSEAMHPKDAKASILERTNREENASPFEGDALQIPITPTPSTASPLGLSSAVQRDSDSACNNQHEYHDPLDNPANWIHLRFMDLDYLITRIIMESSGCATFGDAHAAWDAMSPGERRANLTAWKITLDYFVEQRLLYENS